MATTPRWGLPSPALDDPADVPADVAALALALDGVAMDDAGLWADRPAPANGQYWYATDLGTLWRGDGAAWRPVGVPAPASVTKAQLVAVVQAALYAPGDLKAVGYAVTAGSEPSGWLLCDGRSVLRADYPALFAAVGTTWNPSADSTHFSLPDYRGRFVLGASGGRPVATTGGEESHTLTAAESGVNGSGSVASAGAHDHGGLTGLADRSLSHNHSTRAYGHSLWGHGDNAPIEDWVTNGFATTGDAATPDHKHGISSDGAHSHSLNARGADAPHNNMPPYATAAILIKT